MIVVTALMRRTANQTVRFSRGNSLLRYAALWGLLLRNTKLIFQSVAWVLSTVATANAFGRTESAMVKMIVATATTRRNARQRVSGKIKDSKPFFLFFLLFFFLQT